MTTSSESEMNDWVSLINYAAAFKTAGIRMRGGQLEREQAVLAGAAAASSFKREIINNVAVPNGTPPRKAVFGRADSPATSTTAASPGIDGLPDRSSRMGDDGFPDIESISAGSSIAALAAPSVIAGSNMQPPSMEATVLTKTGRINPDVDAGEQIVKDDGERLEEVFDVVKAELASGGSDAARQVVAAIIDRDKEGHKRQGSGSSARRKHAGRAAEIQRYLALCRERLSAVEAQLSTHIDQARNLAILTPFQRTTREKIASTIPPLAARIRADRLQVARYSIYLSILARDHERDERDFARVRHVAIQAAAKSLSDPKGVKGLLEDEKTQHRPVPTLTLPLQDKVPHISTSTPDEGAQKLARSASPAPSLGHDAGVSGDEQDGYASDAHSIFGHAGGKELPVLFRKGSDETAPMASAMGAPSARAGVIREMGEGGSRRPVFGRTASANSVASSTGSFFGVSRRGGQEMQRQGSNLLAPPTAV